MSRAPVFVIAETRDGTPTALTRELVDIAYRLSGGGIGVVALLFGNSAAAAADLIAHGAYRVYVCRVCDEEYEGELWLPNVEALARELAPSAILIGHTPAGADLAPRLAFRLDTAVAMGCVGVEVSSSRMMFTRACFGGNVRETLSFANVTAVATIKPGVGMAHADRSREGHVVEVDPKPVTRRTRVISRERATSVGKSLEDAKVIVAGGRGLEGPEGFRVLEGLADVLGAAVGSSRVPCDLGWCPHSWQIGLTGKTVTPDLYIAVGISGAGHHMAGCGNAKTIVAINTDAEAAIFKEARFGIVGDYRKVVPALIDTLKENRRAG